MFKLKDDVWLKITQGLLKKKGEGIVADGLAKTGACPLCGSQSETDEAGNIRHPFIFDREHLTFHCQECSTRGGLCNMLMIQNKWTAEKAIKFLEGFIK